MSWQDKLKELSLLGLLNYDEVIPFITDLLKEQREICAGIYMENLPSEKERIYNDNKMIKILNAREPEGETK